MPRYTVTARQVEYYVAFFYAVEADSAEEAKQAVMQQTVSADHYRFEGSEVREIISVEENDGN